MFTKNNSVQSCGRLSRLRGKFNFGSYERIVGIKVKSGGLVDALGFVTATNYWFIPHIIILLIYHITLNLLFYILFSILFLQRKSLKKVEKDKNKRPCPFEGSTHRNNYYFDPFVHRLQLFRERIFLSYYHLRARLRHLKIAINLGSDEKIIEVNV